MLEEKKAERLEQRRKERKQKRRIEAVEVKKAEEEKLSMYNAKVVVPPSLPSFLLLYLHCTLGTGNVRIVARLNCLNDYWQCIADLSR